jgi:hypothetical protein
MLVVSLMTILSISGILNESSAAKNVNISGENHEINHGEVLKVMESHNQSSYKGKLALALSQYEAHDRYASMILEGYLSRSISGRDALTATMSIYALSSETLDMIEQNDAPREYVAFQNNTISSMKYLKDYLLNVAMYYETGNRDYIIRAQTDYNMSTKYHMQAKEDSFFLNS